MNAFLQTAAGNPENQDRGLILEDGSRTILCVADGVGGRSGGAEAAMMAVNLIRQNIILLSNGNACTEVLRKLDEAIAKDPTAGETTCTLVVVAPEEIFGASVGDSGSWMIPETGNHLDLTHAQQRKPFIGSGSAWPVSFHHSNPAGLLLLATDGLLKYTSADRIIGTCRERPIDLVGERLIKLVRYSSGALPDDVTLIIAKL
jgi:serine/threonine protein phosphatase PrpC